MSNRPVKDLLREVAEKLPPDATVEEAMERLHFLSKIERGLTEADTDETISHDEVGRRLDF